MTPEAMKFWLDMFHSPVGLTLSGAMFGAVASLAGVWYKSRHDAKENQKAWERQEQRRKEERLFQLKIKAYEDFADCFTGFALGNTMNFAQNIVPATIRLANYGSVDVRRNNQHFAELLMQSRNTSSAQENAALNHKLIEVGNELHEAIINDINNHHASKESPCA